MLVPAVALLAVLILAGCGVGFGPGEESGSAELAITRDYGSEVIARDSIGSLAESSTAMRLLDQSAEIETRYGGGFVQSIEGISGSSGSRSTDWFYFVNGIAAERGAAEFVVAPGDRMWWDFRDWTDAMNVNAVVGSYPAPMSTGYDGNMWPVVLECSAAAGPACVTVKRRLSEAGIEVTSGSPGPDALRVLVGAWAAIKSDPAASRLASPPSVSGVFARFEESGSEVVLDGLGVSGSTVRRFGGGAGLIAATRRGADPPVWLITGTDLAGVERAAEALGQESLEDRYAAIVFEGQIASLPAPDDTELG
jgi:hypothetical protein